MAKQSQASIKRSIKNLRLIIDDENVDPVTKRMAYFAENTLRWATEDTVNWERPEVDLEDEVALLLKAAADTVRTGRVALPPSQAESKPKPLSKSNVQKL